MGKYYLAVDIGASSGRHMLAGVEGGVIRLEEIHRFENRAVKRGGSLCWDTAHLLEELLCGMRRCAELNKPPVSMGIDTWGVDFALLDAGGSLVDDTVAYRDARTQGMDKRVYEAITPRELYGRTGIQMQIFNTLYQLCSLKMSGKDELRDARQFLMMPEYLNYLLTGVIMNEYTNATTTQLVNVHTKTWDGELIRSIGLDPSLFGALHMPGSLVGSLKPEIRQTVGFDCEVVLPATHDTASAVMAVPAADDDSIYLSSGTWSLIGTEQAEPDCGERSFELNFTNEGGYNYRYRQLKNIMGLWIVQSVRRELGGGYSFDDLCELAREAKDFDTIIDVNDPGFLSPESMIEAIRAYCARAGLTPPQTVGELMACVYNSLAHSYAQAVREIEEITGRRYRTLHIVGGGAKDEYLNALTKRYTGKEVYAGPTEATAIGNLLAQMIRAGEFATLEQARMSVGRSFNIQKVEG